MNDRTQQSDILGGTDEAEDVAGFAGPALGGLLLAGAAGAAAAVVVGGAYAVGLYHGTTGTGPAESAPASDASEPKGK